MTIECLKVEGNEPVDKERLTMLVIVGSRMDEHCFNRAVGMGSRSHCLSGHWLRSLEISSVVTGRKVDRVGGVKGGSECGEREDVIEERILRTLLEKKDAKELARDEVAMEDGSET